MGINTAFPNVPPMNFTQDLTPLKILEVIKEIKMQSPKQFPNRFSNRWDEIKETTLLNLSINHDWIDGGI